MSKKERRLQALAGRKIDEGQVLDGAVLGIETQDPTIETQDPIPTGQEPPPETQDPIPTVLETEPTVQDPSILIQEENDPITGAILQNEVTGAILQEVLEAVANPNTTPAELDKAYANFDGTVVGHEIDEEEELEELSEEEIEQIANKVFSEEEETDPEIEDANNNHDQGSGSAPVAVVAAEPTMSSVMLEIEKLRAQLAEMTAGKAGKAAGGPGSQARPTVTYKLLNKPLKWHSTPQVASIQRILFDQPKEELTEPELFALLEKGKADGLLATRQPAVRVFQYYRNELRKENVLGWT